MSRWQWFGGQNSSPITLTWNGDLVFLILPQDKSAASLVTIPLSDFDDVGATTFLKEIKNHNSNHDPEIRCLYPEGQIKTVQSAAEKAGITVSKWVSINGRPEMHFFPVERKLRIPFQTAQAPTKKSRVLIVDDSVTICNLLTSVLSKDPQLEVVGSVLDPKDVIPFLEKNQIDVITLDIHLPGMNGIELLRKYLPKFPIPTVMVTAVSREEGTFVLDALESGAVDYVQKPTLDQLAEVSIIIVEKVKTAALSKVNAGGTFSTKTSHSSPSNVSMDKDFIILLGASTGGTEALKHVLTRLPKEIPPILIVQHIPPVFSKAFADRLNELCPFTVKEALNGEEVNANCVYIAPGGTQMSLKKSGSRFSLCVDEKAGLVNRHKPSVDHLFENAAELKIKNLVAGILTGMGTDGARGLKKLRDAGVRTVGQDENSCVVYGMPREAARMGGVETVTPLSNFHNVLIDFCKKKNKNAA